MPDAKASLVSDNRLLATLSRAERARVAPGLQEESLEMKQVLFEPSQRIGHIYFPVDAMCCLLTVLKDDSAIEVATVGNEGMLGVGAFLDFDAYIWRGLTQIPGRVLRMEIDDFRNELARSGNLHRIVKRYTHTLLSKVGQSVACNRVHSAEQRCCKWLLLTHDRVANDEFPMTHEFLSQMLGMRRAGVSEIAASLQHAGLIRYRRGVMTVVDRAGLETASCECYETIRAAFERVDS